MENGADSEAKLVIDESSSDKDKKESPTTLQKKCLVCGDKALGYNFNAISCESCKAFFRRNANNTKELKCPFTNNCVITVVTRRFCQKCRLEKCFSIGMVKEFIMSEEDKAEKRKKIEENRAKKRQLHDSSDEMVSSSKSYKRDDETHSNSSSFVGEQSGIQYDVLSSTESIESPDLESSAFEQYLPSQEYQPYNTVGYQARKPLEFNSISGKTIYSQRIEDYSVSGTMDALYNGSHNHIHGGNSQKPTSSIRSILTNGDSIVYQERKVPHQCEELPSTSDQQSQNKARDILQDVQRIEPNSMESILCEAIKLEFEAYTSLNSCNRSSRELNEVERAKLNELIVANKALHAPIDDDVSQLIGNASHAAGFKTGEGKHDPELITIVNLTAIAIRRLIKMAKKISAFKNMCEEDQVALLKGGCTEMMVLRSTMAYDGQRNSWKLPHSCEQFGSIKTDVLKLAKGDIYEAHERFISSFSARWRQDEHVILILSAILLFCPERPRVVHSDVIRLEQNSYYYLLRRYLESVYPGCEAKSTFLKLIQKILELRKLAADITGVYLDVNPIEPLLIEIFDLKQHSTNV